FQAEDGIRGLIVTGVQTCALPISEAGGGFFGGSDHVRDVGVLGLPQWRRDADEDRVALRQDRGLRGRLVASGSQERLKVIAPNRSEERRVGKESDAWGATETRTRS